ncbi:MAG: RagB/SusD family nutrient uptake outer membrane protein, partial [Bacteroidota bacterium]
MKELKKIVFIGLLPFFLGCNDFLEEEALDTFTSLNFPQTVEDAEALVNEAYRLAGAHYASFNYPDVVLYPTEFATTRRQGSGDVRAQLDNYEVNNANSRLASAWNGAYGVIRQANIAIGAAEGIGDDDPDKATYDRLAAEARVIRAYTYYDLLVIFGSVPLIIERLETLEDAERPVSPIAEIYDAIINDLTVAEPLLPHDYEDNSLGRVTRGAARALLGNVHLQRAMDPANVAQGTDLDNAVTWLRRVVDAADGGKAYTLEPEYENLFGLDNVSNNIKFSNEIIFQFWRDINACCRNAYYANS